MIKTPTARELNSLAFGRRKSPSRDQYPAHKTGYAIVNAAGAELQWAEQLGPLMKNIADKRGVTIIRCKDGVTVWPTKASDLASEST